VLNGLYGQFLDNWQLITSLLLLIFIVTLIDQVGLRFYIRLKNEVGLKA
jgi:Tfp pilus assembly protein PilO